MATDLSPLSLDQQYAALFDAMNAQLNALMTQFVSDVTNVPADAVRLNRSTKRWETFDTDAGSWKPAVDRYDIDVARLGGWAPDTRALANTVAVRDSAGRIKSAKPNADDDVLRAVELAQHLQASNPHDVSKDTVGLGNLNNAKQLESAQNLRDLPNAVDARNNLGLKGAALRDVGTDKEDDLVDRSQVNAIVLQAKQAIYPVGSLYFNASNNDNPKDILGFGQWEAYAAGRFVIGSNSQYLAGQTGGSERVTLTVDQMPSHSHRQKWVGDDQDGGRYSGGSFGGYGIYTDTEDTGGGQSHDNMPPYVACNIWRRTA